MKPKMRYGTINCDCSQQFYFETARDKVGCINCGKEHNVTSFLVKVEEQLIEESPEEGE